MATVHKFHVTENENSSTLMTVSEINNLTHESPKLSNKEFEKGEQEKESKMHKKIKNKRKGENNLQEICKGKI